MGVTGLWSIVQPCARPIKLETLNRKRLAVDASIWIYQFLKAVRDKEGNALRNSHVVGFYRRICKLLFFGIKPVFVFDGGAPALKRQTITGRKRRREGRREDAVRTAGKLLAVQMQRRAEEDEQKRKDTHVQEEEAVPDENLVYVDELQMTQQERQQNRKFRKKDAYHLPELDMSMNEMGGPNDPRVMSLEDLEAYARQFDTGEDINVYDFSKIDYDSTFFQSLPASDRYNILNAARLRSRLRMGHSKEQLDSMFPDRMAFSKFQIDRVRERNDLTQRLMNLNGFGGSDMDFGGGPGRVAGEKGREYVLVKNDGVEGGWALGVISDEGTKQEKPIDIDKPERPKVVDTSENEDDGFEDVPIEGLNRLPKRRKLNDDAKQRQAVPKSRRPARRKPKVTSRNDDPDSLFVAELEEMPVEEEEDGSEEADVDAELFGEDEEAKEDDDDEELRIAIAMSLENDQSSTAPHNATANDSPDAEDEDMQEVFQQSAVQEAKPIPKGSARAIANVLNKRAFDVAPESQEVTSFGVPVPKYRDEALPDADEEEVDEDVVDLQAALAESRRGKRKIMPPAPRVPAQPEAASSSTAKKAGFAGPLPFEKLDLGSSLLGKKKMQQRTEDAAGGFENPALTEQEQQKKAEPLPPWFSGDVEEDIQRQREIEAEDRAKAKEFSKQFQFQSREEPRLRRGDTGEVIDLDAEEPIVPFKNGEVIDLEKDEQEKPRDDALRMGDIAEAVLVEPPMGGGEDQRNAANPRKAAKPPFAEEESEAEDVEEVQASAQAINGRPEQLEQADEQIEWSDSEDETRATSVDQVQPAGGATQTVASRSPSVEFEDVLPKEKAESDARVRPEEVQRSPSIDERDIDRSRYDQAQQLTIDHEAIVDDEEESGPAPASGLVQQHVEQDDEFDDFSDPEEEELLKALTLEAEEHARFASTLNNKTTAQNIADYEKELKQLRNQQKKDRRDADEVTHIMITECQQLLRLFGLPYVTAPMEAEAQCAELVQLGLVDGIVTDDSDCFLFGGTRIYKNMFNQAKFVECYLSSDLEKEFDLTREKMIQVAHLLGSDYTEGLTGVGPVTALEIISEFQSLEDFKTWFTGVQMTNITKEDDKGNAFRNKFRKQATKMFLPSAFPDARVDIAYLSPDVDADPEPFQWGVPDLDALRTFLMATIGWSQERTDEVLVPVIRDMNKRLDEGTQANITAFFDGGVGIGAAGAGQQKGRGEAFAPRRRAEGSKRMGTALSRMAERAKFRRSNTNGDAGPEPNADGDGAAQRDGGPIASASRKAQRRSTKKRTAATDAADGSDEEASEFEAPRKKAQKRSAAGKGRKKRAVDAD